MASFKSIYEDTREFEGGFQNMSADTGNYCDGKLIGTNYGIAATGYKGFYGRCPSVDEIKNLRPEQAYEISKKNYWDKVQGDKIKTQGLAHLIFDIVYGGSGGYLNTRQAINEVAGKNLVKDSRTPAQLSDYEVSLINTLDQKKLFDTIYKKRKEWLVGNTYEKNLTGRVGTIYNKYISDIGTGAKITYFFVKKHKWVIIVIIVLIIIAILMIVYRKKLVGK